MFFHNANAAAAWPGAVKCKQSKPKNDLTKLPSCQEKNFMLPKVVNQDNRLRGHRLQSGCITTCSEEQSWQTPSHKLR